jgi:hypothetical protein
MQSVQQLKEVTVRGCAITKVSTIVTININKAIENQSGINCPIGFAFMQFVSIPLIFKESQYFISELTGDLIIKVKGKNIESRRFSKKLINALSLCDNPYRIKFIPNTTQSFISESRKIRFKANFLIYLCKINFFLAHKYASFKDLYFSDSSDAIAYFHSATGNDETNNLCLPRTLFAAKTSRIFDNEGVIFIGAFLPSRSMHAWIIEKGTQPDRRDNIWHQYRPIAAIC